MFDLGEQQEILFANQSRTAEGLTVTLKGVERNANGFTVLFEIVADGPIDAPILHLFVSDDLGTTYAGRPGGGMAGVGDNPDPVTATWATRHVFAPSIPPTAKELTLEISGITTLQTQTPYPRTRLFTLSLPQS